jgi:hypothetical protein
MKDKKIDEYDEKESRLRFEAALRGARIAGPKHNESLTPKRRKKQSKQASRKTEPMR